MGPPSPSSGDPYLRPETIRRPLPAEQAHGLSFHPPLPTSGKKKTEREDRWVSVGRN